jgi:hypothetical protein
MNRGRNARIAVKPSVQEFDLKSSRFRAVTNSAKIAGGDGGSVHGDTSSLMNEDACEGSIQRKNNRKLIPIIAYDKIVFDENGLADEMSKI